MIEDKAFFKLSYGLYIVTSAFEDQHSGQIANAVTQVTAEPPMLAVCINKQNYTYELIQKSKLIGMSVLTKDTPMEFIGKFGFKSGRDIDKFEGVQYKKGETGVPVVLDNSASYFEIKVENQIDVFTHTIFIGRIVNARMIKDDEEITYKYYQEIKHGKSPKTAPTYIDRKVSDDMTKDVKGEKYQCTICGYVYDPAKGDPDSGILPGTAFEDIPDDWVCPICGASKEQFEKIS